jgi:hypothetical protein
MRHAAWALGYHGCDESVGEAILKGAAEVVPSTNEHDWLGAGAYFWENSYARALEWSKYLKTNPTHATSPIEKPFVVGAIIDPGNCLDLSESACLAVVKEAFINLKELMEKTGVPLPVNGRGYPGDIDLVERRLDCAVINNLHQIRKENSDLPPFDTVRGLFTEGRELFEGAKIQSKTHVQWCVRNSRKSILGYFRPRQLME